MDVGALSAEELVALYAAGAVAHALPRSDRTEAENPVLIHCFRSHAAPRVDAGSDLSAEAEAEVGPALVEALRALLGLGPPDATRCNRLVVEFPPKVVLGELVRCHGRRESELGLSKQVLARLKPTPTGWTLPPPLLGRVNAWATAHAELRKAKTLTSALASLVFVCRVALPPLPPSDRSTAARALALAVQVLADNQVCDGPTPSVSQPLVPPTSVPPSAAPPLPTTPNPASSNKWRWVGRSQIRVDHELEFCSALGLLLATKSPGGLTLRRLLAQRMSQRITACLDRRRGKVVTISLVPQASSLHAAVLVRVAGGRRSLEPEPAGITGAEVHSDVIQALKEDMRDLRSWICTYQLPRRCVGRFIGRGGHHAKALQSTITSIAASVVSSTASIHPVLSILMPRQVTSDARDGLAVDLIVALPVVIPSLADLRHSIGTNLTSGAKDHADARRRIQQALVVRAKSAEANEASACERWVRKDVLPDLANLYGRNTGGEVNPLRAPAAGKLRARERRAADKRAHFRKLRRLQVSLVGQCLLPDDEVEGWGMRCEWEREDRALRWAAHKEASRAVQARRHAASQARSGGQHKPGGELPRRQSGAGGGSRLRAVLRGAAQEELDEWQAMSQARRQRLAARCRAMQRGRGKLKGNGRCDWTKRGGGLAASA